MDVTWVFDFLPSTLFVLIYVLCTILKFWCLNVKLPTGAYKFMRLQFCNHNSIAPLKIQRFPSTKYHKSKIFSLIFYWNGLGCEEWWESIEHISESYNWFIIIYYSFVCFQFSTKKCSTFKIISLNSEFLMVVFIYYKSFNLYSILFGEKKSLKILTIF